MAGQRMQDYQRVIGALRGCENMLENFKRSFAVLQQAKEEIFDDATRRANFVQLVTLDTDTTISALQADYAKYKTVNDWLETNG